MVLYADHALAVRLESLAAQDTLAFAETSAALYPESGAAWLRVAGGIAGFSSPDSAVNGTSGVGLEREVTETDLMAIERFFLGRCARPVISVCPLAHASLTRCLAARRWVPAGFENVLVRELLDDERFGVPDDGIEIRLAETAAERLRWASLVVDGFAAPHGPTPAETRLGLTASAMSDRVFLTAFADGEPAGTGELRVADGIGWLSADTTLPAFRQRGVQISLQRVRLELARDAGCALAVTESAPGGPSQRNMERNGFRLVYTRMELAGPEPA